MEWLISFAAARARWVLVALLAITGFAVLLLPRLDVRISTDSMMVEGGADGQVYQESLRTFGSSDAVIVFVHDDDLFTPKSLAAVRSLVDELGGLPFVEAVDSLFSVQQGRLSDDELVEFAPYLEPIPTTPQAVAAVKSAALANPFVARNLLSVDGRTMAVNVRLKDGVGGEHSVVQAIEAAIGPLRAQVDEVFALGQAHVSASISAHIVNDQAMILPLSLVALLLALLFALGRWEGVVVPLLTAVASVIWTLAFMVLIDISLNVMTSVVPLLLVVVGSTEDVHLLSAYCARRGEGLGNRPAIDAMAAGTGLAVLLTFATTFMGFLAITLNDIRLLRDFGLVASSGLLFNFVITTLMVPAVLALRDSCSLPVRESGSVDLYKRIARWLYRLAFRRRLLILLVTLLLLAGALLGALKLRVNNNIMDYLPDGSEVIEQAQRLHRELAGIQSFDVLLSSGIEGTFERLRYLQEIEKLQRFLDHTGHFDKTLSFNDLLKEVNRVMEGLSPGEHYLPEHDAVVREFLLFMDAEYRRAYVSDDLSETRITVRHNITSSHALKQALAGIEGFVAQHIDPGLQVTVTGESILNQRAGDALAAGQAKSLMLIVATIFLIVTVVFVNPKAGALAVVPNLLPIIILFGVMGFSGLPLSTGTAMVAAIAVGICVDDTIHFLMRYHQEIARQPSSEDAILATMEEEARPIMSTSVALSLGFGVLALSSFPPVVHFGLLAALVFVLALVATFVVTPILLSYVHLVTLWDVLGVQLKSTLTENCVLFHDMRPLQVRKLIAMSSRRVFEASEKIVRQGDESHELFVILAGRARAQRAGADGELEILNTMGVGDVFGEIGLAADTGRTADVVALENTEVLTLRWTDLQNLARYMPRTSSRLILNIASGMGKRMISRHF